MAKPNLCVLKWLGTTPAIAICTGCNCEFKVPLEILKRVGGAPEYLKAQFARNQCAQGPDAAPT